MVSADENHQVATVQNVDRLNNRVELLNERWGKFNIDKYGNFDGSVDWKDWVSGIEPGDKIAVRRTLLCGGGFVFGTGFQMLGTTEYEKMYNLNYVKGQKMARDVKTDYAIVTSVLWENSRCAVEAYNPNVGFVNIRLVFPVEQRGNLLATCAIGDKIEYTTKKPYTLISNLSHYERVAKFQDAYKVLTNNTKQR